jgi:hypothetical protein
MESRMFREPIKVRLTEAPKNILAFNATLLGVLSGRNEKEQYLQVICDPRDSGSPCLPNGWANGENSRRLVREKRTGKLYALFTRKDGSVDRTRIWCFLPGGNRAETAIKSLIAGVH